MFVFAFAKNEQDSIAPGEFWRLKLFAQDWLSADDADITNALESGELEEVKYEQS